MKTLIINSNATAASRQSTYIASLQLAVVAAIMTAATTQAAFAADSGNARFTYAPNIYRVEMSHVPASVPEAPHQVKNGAVPQGPSFLGLSPKMLTKPAAQQVTAATTSFTQATPEIGIPKFNAAFGKAAAPVVANKPESVAAPVAAKAAPAKAAHFSKPVVAHRSNHASKDVHAVLARAKESKGVVADAKKQIDSYGGGYVPGPFLPASYAGDGSTAQATVLGKVLNQQ